MFSAGGLTPGHAGYFENEVAQGREDYYAGLGESPGLWRGAGSGAMGLSGEITEGQLARLFNFQHPETGEALGSPYKVSGTYTDRFGNEQPRHMRSAFDLTFSLPKSVSEVYAQGDEETRQRVLDAAQVALDEAVKYLDTHAAFSRIGKGGKEQINTDGLIVGQYMHRTSRAGDPQLHFHTLVSNKVHCADGKWRALDGKPLFREMKTAGMLGQAVLRGELSRSLGVSWGEVSQHGQADIEGVPVELMDFHSTRTREVEAHAKAAIRSAEDQLGRTLTPAERAEKYDKAALLTRKVKSRDLEPIEGLNERWRKEATELGHDPQQWFPDVVAQRIPIPHLLDSEIVTAAVEILTETKSTWTASEARRVVSTLVPWQHHSGVEVAERINAVTDRLVASQDLIVDLDGQRFSTITNLLREYRVVDFADSGKTAGVAVASAEQIEAAVTARAAGGQPLSSDQEMAVDSIASSGNKLDVLVGPAGAGKSKTVEALADAYQRSGIAVMGLAISSVAAEVLRDEAALGWSDTVAKLLYEHNQPKGPAAEYEIPSGAVLVVDEASMVSSQQFAHLADLVEANGAKIVAVGDYRQIGSVGAGGLFRLLAESHPQPNELSEIWRFSNAWEREASLRLRNGDESVIEVYEHHDRVQEGARDELIAEAFNEWANSYNTNESLLVTAADNTTVDQFNDLARRHLKELGHIHPAGITVDGQEISVGEHIITTRNARQLQDEQGHIIRNRDQWKVTATSPSGELRAVRMHPDGSAGARATLPAEYVQAGNVAYGYARTTYQAQGKTVDRGISIVDQQHSSRETLYVGATRGRHSNRLLVNTESGSSDEYGLNQQPERSARHVLKTVIANERSERSALDHVRDGIDDETGPFGVTPPAVAARWQQQEAERQQKRSRSHDRGRSR